MNKIVLSVLIVLGFSIIIAFSTVGYQTNILYVDDDNIDGPWDGTLKYPFRFIQDALNVASPEDTIFIKSGYYTENIAIDLPRIVLKGENKKSTIIDGDAKSDGIQIYASGVTITGVTIVNGSSDDESFWDCSGVKIFSSDCIIRDNIICDNKSGLSIMPSSRNCIINDNEFFNDGILMGNYIPSGTLSIDDFDHHIKNNTVNGKPLYYFKDKHDVIVPNNAGQIILVNCTNVTIRDVEISETDFSIILGFCTNCAIMNNSILNTYGELILFHSSYCTINQNILMDNLHGVCLDYQSDFNIVSNNDIYNNLVGISILSGSSHNKIINNDISQGNGIGVFIGSYVEEPITKQNIICDNTLEENNVGVKISDKSSENIVDNNFVIKHRFGITISNQSTSNRIVNNTFRTCLIPSLFSNCRGNTWDHNFWNRPRLFPKLILGFHTSKTGYRICFESDQDPVFL